MNNRILFGAVLCTAIFYLIFAYAPVNLMSDWHFQLYFGIELEVTLACLLLKIFHSKFIDKPYGFLIFRGLFSSHAWAYALVASMQVRMLLLQMPLGVYNISATVILLWGCAVGVSSFAFDFVACAMFLVLLISPTVYASAFELKNTEGITLSYLGSLLFFLFLARMLHLAEIAALELSEKIRDQGLRLNDSIDALQASNGLFQDTLDSIDEIFLLIDLEGTCYGSPCVRALNVLGMNPIAKSFADILHLEGEQREDALLFFQLLAKDQIDFEMALPDGLAIYNDTKNGLAYRVRFFPKRSSDNLAAVIMTFTDITQQLRADIATEEANARASFLLAVNENRTAFSAFLFEAAQFFRELQFWDGSAPDEMRMKLHTMKGTAAIFHVRTIAREINNAEQLMKTAVGGDPNEFVKLVKTLAAELNLSLNEWIELEHDWLDKLHVFAQDEIRVSVSQAELIKRSFIEDNQTPTVEKMFSRLQARRIDQTLQAYSQHLRALSNKLDKEITFKLRPSQRYVFYTGPAMEALFDSLIHLINNAADHGIESPAERIRKGKPSQGTIQASYVIKEKSLEIVIRDDGGGIDLQKVKTLLQNKGVDASAWDDRKILLSIFDVGFSTRETATDISGQGVGLSALHNQIVSLGGRLEVYTELGRGTDFQINLPFNENQIFSVSKSPDEIGTSEAA